VTRDIGLDAGVMGGSTVESEIVGEGLFWAKTEEVV